MATGEISWLKVMDDSVFNRHEEQYKRGDYLKPVYYLTYTTVYGKSYESHTL